MDSGWIVLAELVLVFGLIIGFGIWQIVSLRRDRRASGKRATADAATPDADRGSADGRSP